MDSGDVMNVLCISHLSETSGKRVHTKVDSISAPSSESDGRSSDKPLLKNSTSAAKKFFRKKKVRTFIMQCSK